MRKILFFLGIFLSPINAWAEKIKIVTSFSILHDITEQIAGDKAQVTSLVGRNQDSHSWQPTPQDAVRLKNADLIIVNGLGFEGWIDRLIKTSAVSVPVLVASQGISPLPISDNDHHDEHNDHDHHHDSYDPHAWQDVRNVILYVRHITKGLQKKDSEHADFYQKNSDAYIQKLTALDHEIRTQIELIHPDKRKVITSHNAFGYFAHAYGVLFLSAQGVISDAPSAQHLGRLVTQMRKENINALYGENISDKRFIAQIEKEVGKVAIGQLYADALSYPSGNAPTYIDMMRYNLGMLIRGMKNNP